MNREKYGKIRENGKFLLNNPDHRAEWLKQNFTTLEIEDYQNLLFDGGLNVRYERLPGVGKIYHIERSLRKSLSTSCSVLNVLLRGDDDLCEKILTLFAAYDVVFDMNEKGKLFL